MTPKGERGGSAMSIYAIGDLHLSLGCPEKTMEVFRGWRGESC